MVLLRPAFEETNVEDEDMVAMVVEKVGEEGC